MEIAASVGKALLAVISISFLLTISSSCRRPDQELSLVIGRTVQGRLSASQTDSYRIKPGRNEFVRLTLAQQGGAMVIRLFDPQQRPSIEMHNRSEGITPLSFLSKGEGEWTITIQPATTLPAKYELKVEERRPPVAQDELCLAAEKIIAEAEQLQREGRAEQYQEAIRKYATAGEPLAQAGQIAEKAYALRRMGNLHHRLGDLAQALTCYQQSLLLSQQIGDGRAQADLYNDLSSLSLQQGVREKAQEACTEALRRSQSLNYVRGIAQALTHQGAISNAAGDPASALQQETRALRYWEELEAYNKQAETYLGIGASHYYLGQYQDSIHARSQALQLYQKLNDEGGQARALTFLGHLYSTLGAKQEALNQYQLARPLLSKVSDKVTEYSLASGLGFVYEELGETGKALEQRKQALAFAHAAGYKEDEALCAMHVAELHHALGDHDQALASLQQARTFAWEIGDPRIEAQVLRSMGNVYQSRRERGTAMRYYQQAIALYPAAYSSRWKAYAHNNIGELYAEVGNTPQAVTHYQQALAYNLAAEDRFGESQTRYHLARVTAAQGNATEALAQMEKVVALVESLRAQVSRQELRTSYFATVNQIYALYLDLLMQQSPQQAAAALAVSERARARSLLDLLSEARHNIKQGVEPKLLAQEQALLQQLNRQAERRMQMAGNQDKAQELATLSRELDELQTQIEDLRAKIRATSPRYATLTQPQPLAAPEIQQLLDDNTLLLEFALGEARSYVWAVTKNTLTAYSLPKREIIEKLSSEVYALLIAAQPQSAELPPTRLVRIKQANAAYWPKAAALSQMLLAPLAAQLGNKRLLIVADGALQRIPFAALPVVSSPLSVANTKDHLPPLITNHEISYLPSASILSVLRKERARMPVAAADSWLGSIRRFFQASPPAPRAPGALDSIAILADPVFAKEDSRLQPGAIALTPSEGSSGQTREVDLSDENLQLNRLRATADEAAAIKEAAGAQAFLLKTGFAVNRALLEGEALHRYSILHFATHGYWDSERPELSGLVLSRYDEHGQKQDGFLRLSDIYNLRLPQELVVLSACETALGKDIRGEGLLALTRGFMYAGAARVMASLWKVEEGATVALMKVFYGKLLREQRTPAAALREAQLALWRQDPTSAPYDWAAFVLQGEYR